MVTAAAEINQPSGFFSSGVDIRICLWINTENWDTKWKFDRNDLEQTENYFYFHFQMLVVVTAGFLPSLPTTRFCFALDSTNFGNKHSSLKTVVVALPAAWKLPAHFYCVSNQGRVQQA